MSPCSLDIILNIKPGTYSWFLKIAFGQEGGMCACVCPKIMIVNLFCIHNNTYRFNLVLGGIIFLLPVYGITNSEWYSLFHGI